MKKIFISISLLVVILIVILVTISKDTETPIIDHPMIGQVFLAGDFVFYMEDCNNFHSCGDTPRSNEINRSLVCGALNSTVTPIYNNSYQILKETTFELIELLEIESHGLNSLIGGSGYVMAVLKDNDGLLSTRLFSLPTQLYQPYGYANNTICNGQDG